MPLAASPMMLVILPRPPNTSSRMTARIRRCHGLNPSMSLTPLSADGRVSAQDVDVHISHRTRQRQPAGARRNDVRAAPGIPLPTKSVMARLVRATHDHRAFPVFMG